MTEKPNHLWSWDITKLKGPQKWTYYYLYTTIDIFSRYVVGWMVAYRQTGTLAKDLIAESTLKQNIEPGQLIIHSDRGKQMRSKTLGQLLIDLGIIKSFSRPHVPDDNPYSESHFGILKGDRNFLIVLDVSMMPGHFAGNSITGIITNIDIQELEC